jgi:hypothetical protein
MPKLGNLFVARDRNGSLYVYRCVPDVNKATGKYLVKTRGCSPQRCMSINPKLFPDLKFEDGVKEVELVIKEL